MWKKAFSLLRPRGNSALSRFSAPCTRSSRDKRIRTRSAIYSRPFTMFSYLNPLPQLPKYRGPYPVGSCEYEIPVSEIPSSTTIPDASVTTIKFRVFYPTTENASSKTPIPWLPSPQKEWNKAYANFLGFSDRSANFVANMPSMLNNPTLPVVRNGPLREKPSSGAFPVAIFSHGLGGNYNAYSSFVGSLASCGMVVFAPEHRDQSAPVSFVRSSQGEKKGRPVIYRKISHSPRVDVLNGRNEMLRIRLWEMEKLFSAVTALNDGMSFTNYMVGSEESLPSFQNHLDLTTGKVTWSGHSFGAATAVQFVKSVYYRQFAPDISQKSAKDEGDDWTPLYTPAQNDRLFEQITSASPMVLLDLWTMPLTSNTTQWLWEKPLPCYDRKSSPDGEGASPSVISIMSTQFYKWSELLNRTKALLSENPVETYERLTSSSAEEQQKAAEDTLVTEPSDQLTLDPITRLETSKTRGLSLNQGLTDTSSDFPTSSKADGELSSESSTRTPSPARSDDSTFSASSPVQPTEAVISPVSVSGQTAGSSASASSSLSSLHVLPGHVDDKSAATQSKLNSYAPLLYLVPTSAHLSQSDFGVLFPNVTKWLLKTIEPQQIMDLNVRAATALIRGCGLDVALLTNIDQKQKKKQRKPEGPVLQDQILEGHGPGAGEEVWKRIAIEG